MKKPRKVQPMLVVPEDGLHKAIEQFKQKLGPEGFVRALLEAIPPQPSDSSVRKDPALNPLSEF